MQAGRCDCAGGAPEGDAVLLAPPHHRHDVVGLGLCRQQQAGSRGQDQQKREEKERTRRQQGREDNGPLPAPMATTFFPPTGVVLGVDAARVLVQALAGVDAAGDGAAAEDLGPHRVRPLHPPMLLHHQPLVLLQGQAALAGPAGVALVLVVALLVHSLVCEAGQAGEGRRRRAAAREGVRERACPAWASWQSAGKRRLQLQQRKQASS